MRYRGERYLGIVMGKSTKTQRLREEVRAAVKQSKQTTLDNAPKSPRKEHAEPADPERRKQIVITEIGTVAREDELQLRVGFKLLPSKTAFSRLTAKLHFDGQKLNTLRIRVPQGPLAADDSEFASVLDMKGIAAGSHAIKVEVCELWGSGEKLTCTTKEVTVEYTPLRREDRLVRIPIVKSFAGTDLEIVSDSEREIYRELEEDIKREETSKRDEW